MGTTGPITAPVFLAYGLVKGAFLATAAAGPLAVYVAKAAVFRTFGALPAEAIAQGLIIGASLMAGSFVAKRFVLKLEPAQLRLKLTNLEEAQAAVAERTQTIRYERTSGGREPRPTPAEWLEHAPLLSRDDAPATASCAAQLREHPRPSRRATRRIRRNLCRGSGAPDASAQSLHTVLGAHSDDGTLVGSLGLAVEERMKQRHKALVFGIFVAPGRGRGIARAARRASRGREASRPGLLNLTVTATAPAAAGCTRQLGFARWRSRAGDPSHGASTIRGPYGFGVAPPAVAG